MNEERALKDVTTSETTRWLLNSAESDASDSGAMQRALKGLGLAPVVVAGLASKSALAATSASSVGASVVTKWIGIGLVTSLSLLGAAELVSRVRHDAAPPQPAPATSAFVAKGTRREAPPLPTTPAEPARVVTPPKRARSASKAPPVATTIDQPLPSSAAFEGGPASTSAAELAALGRARRRLQSGAAADALTQLNDFDRRYPRSGLSEEAMVLRVETLLALGHRDEAQALGARFLAERSGSVYAARVRTLSNIP